MARVQVQGTSPQVALTPQAAPTNTYYQPEQPQMSDAEYRAKMIENTLSTKVDPMLEKIAHDNYKQQIETAKDEIAIASAADMSVFREQLEPELRGLSAEEVQAKVAEKFQERYGDIENPYLATALQKQAAMLAIDVSEKNQKAKVVADKQAFLGNVTRLVSDEIAKLDNKEITQDQFNANVEEIFKTSVWRKGDKSLVKPDGATLLKAIAETGLLHPNSDAVLSYFDATGHSKTSGGAYDTELRQLKNARIKREGEVWNVGIHRELDDLAAGGNIVAVRKRIDALIPEYQKRGLSIAGLETYETRARTAQKKQTNLALQSVAEKRAAFNLITTGELGGETWTDADGKTHDVSKGAVQRLALQMGNQAGGSAQETVLTSVVDPKIRGTITMGLNAVFSFQSAMDKASRETATAQIQAATAEFERLSAMPPAVLLKQIPNKEDREMLRMMTLMSKAGNPTDDIARTANMIKIGKAPVASVKIVDDMVEEVSSTLKPWYTAIPFLGMDVTVSPEMRDTLGYYYMMSASRNLTPEDAKAEAIERFAAEHELMSFEGGINFIYNKNDAQLAVRILGKDGAANPKAAIDLIPDAAQAAMARIRKTYPDANKKNEPVMIMQDYFRPDRLVITYKSGAGVVGSTVIKPSEIPTLAREWRNKDRKKAAAQPQQQDDLFTNAMP